MNRLNPLFKIVIFIYSFIYLLSCFTPWVNTIYLRFYTYLALLFPWFLVGMLFILLLSLFFFRNRSIVILILILIGYKNIASTTGLNYPKKYCEQKQIGTIRLLSWNVDDFVDCEKRHDSLNSRRHNIINFIKSKNADVMCFQDFSNFDENKTLFSNMKYLLDTLKYPYYYFSVDDPCTTEYYPRKYGAIILSKFPIIDSGRFAYNRKHLPEHCMYATLNINGKEVRFYNTHLRSMFLHWHGGDKNTPFTIDDSKVITRGTTLEKLKYFDSIHAFQAKLIKAQLNQCKIPYVFCADLNSVPSSYVYHHISSGLNDAFLQNGIGWGGTYTEILPSLRIDVVLYSNQITTTQYYSPRLHNASDHYPIVTDIVIH